MEIVKLIPLVRRWWWLLLAGAILGSAVGFLFSKIQTPVYEASTKVLVSRGRQQGGADVLFIGDQQLLFTYIQLLKTRPILDDVESKLGIKVYSDMVQVNNIADTQIIQIKVQTEDAAQAAAIANTLVQTLIEQNETLYAGRYAAYEEGLNAQITQVQKQIDSLQGQITQINQENVKEQLAAVNQQMADLQGQMLALENEIAEFPALLSTVDRASLVQKQSQLAQLRSSFALYQEIQTNLTILRRATTVGTGRQDTQVDTLQSTLSLYQKLYLNLLDNLSTAKLARVQSTPTVSQIDRAVMPGHPIRPIPLLYTLLPGIGGLFLAAVSILLREYLDDTLKSSQKTREVLGIPVIGEIVEINRKYRKNGNLHLTNEAGSAISNAFGSLRMNVSRLIEHKRLKTVLVTSSASGEGKTTISLNLAAAFVRSGKRVVLLEADFYHPQLQSRLGLDSERGLTDILVDGIDWQEVAHDFGGIKVITSGVHSLSSTALLESRTMSQLLGNMLRKADLVIIDGPPLFIEDAQILASKVAGVLLIIRQANTLTSAARAMIDQLRLINANVLGAVLNGIPKADSYYFNGYYRNISKRILQEKIEEVKTNQN